MTSVSSAAFQDVFSAECHYWLYLEYKFFFISYHEEFTNGAQVPKIWVNVCYKTLTFFHRGACQFIVLANLSLFYNSLLEITAQVRQVITVFP